MVYHYPQKTGLWAGFLFLYLVLPYVKQIFWGISTSDSRAETNCFNALHWIFYGSVPGNVPGNRGFPFLEQNGGSAGQSISGCRSNGDVNHSHVFHVSKLAEIYQPGVGFGRAYLSIYAKCLLVDSLWRYRLSRPIHLCIVLYDWTNHGSPLVEFLGDIWEAFQFQTIQETHRLDRYRTTDRIHSRYPDCYSIYNRINSGYFQLSSALRH